MVTKIYMNRHGCVDFVEATFRRFKQRCVDVAL